MAEPWIASAEIDPELPILLVTDINGYQLRYLLGQDCQLSLGRVVRQISRDKKWYVTFFDEVGPHSTPQVLKVEAADK